MKVIGHPSSTEHQRKSAKEQRILKGRKSAKEQRILKENALVKKKEV